MKKFRTSYHHNHWRRLNQVNCADSRFVILKNHDHKIPLCLLLESSCVINQVGDALRVSFLAATATFLRNISKADDFCNKKLSQPFAASCIKGKYWKSFQCHHRVLQVSTPTINCLPCNFFGDDICVLWWKMVVLSIDLLWMDHKLQKSSTIMPILGNPFKIWRHSIDFKRDRPTICFYCSNLLFRNSNG